MFITDKTKVIAVNIRDKRIVKSFDSYRKAARTLGTFNEGQRDQIKRKAELGALFDGLNGEWYLTTPRNLELG